MLRLATGADIPAMLDIYGPYVLTTTHTFEYRVPTQEEFTARFEKITEMFPWLVWEENGQVLGYAYASLPFQRSAYQWDCEVSIYLDPKIHGRGIGRKLYTALERLLVFQGYRVIYSLITSENTHSVGFHEKLGYRFVAELPGCGVKFGRWLGVIWLEKRVENLEIPTESPVKWREIVENDEKFVTILSTLALS